jgi:hypothetical protein
MEWNDSKRAVVSAIMLDKLGRRLISSLILGLGRGEH